MPEVPGRPGAEDGWVERQRVEVRQEDFELGFLIGTLERLVAFQEVVEGGGGGGVPRRATRLAAPVALEPGERSVTSSVTVTFQLR